MTTDYERGFSAGEWILGRIRDGWVVYRDEVINGKPSLRFASGRGKSRVFSTRLLAQAFADKLNKVKQ